MRDKPAELPLCSCAMGCIAGDIDSIGGRLDMGRENNCRGASGERDAFICVACRIERTADPSISLRFGRYDKFVWGG